MLEMSQTEINAKVECVLEELNAYVTEFGGTYVSKLRTCNANVYVTTGFTYLKSYNTIVACISHTDGVLYDFLRLVYGYTSTSCQHIRKFAQDYQKDTDKRLTYRPV